MKHYFSVGAAAKAVHTTSETLRHYDRIGLVKPSKKDEWTNYRYYTEQDIVRLHTVRALQLMDLSLQEIKRILEYDDLERIVDFLAQAEKKADEKISSLQYGKAKILLAKADYERKLALRKRPAGVSVKDFPERVILLSDTLEKPALDNLWNYLSHFHDQVARTAPALKERFAFEDQAGIYTENGVSELFAVCTRYADISGLRVLPGGKYLCADCTEENREWVSGEIMRAARTKYGVEPASMIQLIVVSGILRWNYEVQVLIGR